MRWDATKAGLRLALRAQRSWWRSHGSIDPCKQILPPIAEPIDPCRQVLVAEETLWRSSKRDVVIKAMSLT